jgi:DNA-binding MarR family transcriptional regulator
LASAPQLADLLPQAFDRFLRVHTGMGQSYHQVLALLSTAPDQRLRMSELAARTSTSKSRASRAVARLEELGWVSRCCDTTDGRVEVEHLRLLTAKLLDDMPTDLPPRAVSGSSDTLPERTTPPAEDAAG